MSKYEIAEHVQIEMSDGIKLSARLWIPEARSGGDTHGVVLEYIPYRKEDAYRALDDFCGDALASQGIAFARVDVRGSGESQGVIVDEYTEQEILDGLAVIEWLARQSWCNGNVGMRGLSWGAINTLYLAERQPSALRAILPIAGTDNRFENDAHFIGGHVAHTGFQWGTLFKIFLAAPPDPLVSGEAWRSMWQERLNASPPLLANWLSRERLAWQPLDISKIEVPTYFVAGLNDTYAVPTWRMWQGCRAEKKLLLGPWNHMYPYFAQPLGLNWIEEEVAWWQQWLTDRSPHSKIEYRIFIPQEVERQAGGQAQQGTWHLGEGEPETQERTLYLTHEGLRDVPGLFDKIVLDDDHVVGQCKPEWLDRAAIEQSHDDALSITFDSEPLTNDLTCLGTAQLNVNIETEQDAASLAVRICAITPDGQSWLVADKVQNLSGQSGQVEIDLGLIAHQFNRGERIRVSLSQSLWPLVWPLPGDKRVAVLGGQLHLQETKLDSSELDLETFERRTSLATYSPAAHDSAGKLSLVHEVAPVVQASGVPGREISVSRGSREVSEIVQTDPLSALWTQEVVQAWERDDWQCTMTAGYRLRSDEDYFYLDEWLTASYADEEVFKQEESAKLPRSGR